MPDLRQTRYTLIGTGRMGTALAAALLAGEHELTVWNRSTERARPLLEKGAAWADDPATAVRDADLVVVCLLDIASTFDVLGDASVRAALAGKTILQISTGSAEDAQGLAEWAAATRAALLVAFVKAYPREIGTKLAEVHFSGSAEAYDLHREALACWGRTQFVGPDVGAATARNTAGILMMFSLMSSFAEGAAYASARGVAPAEVEDLLPVSFRLASAAIRRAVESSAGLVRPEPEATMDVYTDALRLVASATSAAGVPSRLGEASLDLFTEAVRAGLGGGDLDVLLDGGATRRTHTQVRTPPPSV